MKVTRGRESDNLAVAMIPYISTDRADLIRIVEHTDRVRTELQAIPARSSKIQPEQWAKLSNELNALLALSRRIKERINA